MWEEGEYRMNEEVGKMREDKIRRREDRMKNRRRREEGIDKIRI
jgi:hypothetical protein